VAESCGGGGTITAVNHGTCLTGCATSGNVTQGLDTSKVPTLAATSLPLWSANRSSVLIGGLGVSRPSEPRGASESHF
jgi:hypothetical protein